MPTYQSLRNELKAIRKQVGSTRDPILIRVDPGTSDEEAYRKWEDRVGRPWTPADGRINTIVAPKQMTPDEWDRRADEIRR